ncbi:MAG TPA: hypothetical protein VHI52_13390, partial [Verrucomicrobiae bacterium]|nr:hypothetical protein [Verrucomicrobiae bacterium]
RVDSGESQSDAFSFEVLPRPPAPDLKGRVALFDPVGETAKMLTSRGVSFQSVDASASLSGFDVLMIGKRALTVDGAAPALDRVRDGLKVVVFEQTGAVLENRLGFRVEEYGLRQVWPRVAGSPLLSSLNSTNLRDWRGASTLLPPTMDYSLNPRFSGAPSVRWCGLEVTRLWRCGNWGNVASVLIQKPSRGDFLPIVDGGYALEFSPLLEYREGQGMVLFCQMDVTGRTESDPAAEILFENILRYVDTWHPSARRSALYAGEPAGLTWLKSCGIDAGEYMGGKLAPDQVVILGPHPPAELRSQASPLADWLKQGGHLLALGLDQAEADAYLPQHVSIQSAEHIAAWFPACNANSPFAGVAPADVHNRDPRALPLLTGGATTYGDGVLAQSGNVVLCQLLPWQFETDPDHFNQRRTFARSSVALSRILGNLGVSGNAPLLQRFARPVNAASGTSILTNGDFKLDTNHDGLADGWEFSGGPQGTVCTREAFNSGWSEVIKVPSLTPDAKPPEVMLAQHDLPIRKGQWYRLSLVTRAADFTARTINWTIQNTANWQPLMDYQNFAPTPDWHTNTFMLQAKDTAAKGTKFQIWFSGTGKVWLADVRLEQMPDPALGRWASGMYLLEPTEWDDPYRFFGW